jgi:dolichol-phosphate mannosyltransferase
LVATLSVTKRKRALLKISISSANSQASEEGAVEAMTSILTRANLLAALGAPGETAATIPGPEISIVVPTFKERDNVPVLVGLIDKALAGRRWEIIFVDDDSPDGTADAAKALAAADGRVRCLKRLGRRGLAGACIEGMLASSAPVVAVMDADLQHDEALLPLMLAAIEDGAQVVAGSRYVDGGTTGSGLSANRERGSHLATWLARRLLGVELTDPMSGFFMLRRDFFDRVAPRLSAQGFKILLDIMASAPEKPVTRELPFTFRERQYGESKLDTLVVLEYLSLVLSKLFGDWLSIRFVLFALVGATGVVVHLAALSVGLIPLGFDGAQAVATGIAMVWNFWLNNRLTYRDRRLRGGAALLGLLTFCAVCSVGAIANVGVASWMYHAPEAWRPSWWLAGTAGALMGAVFNYAVSSVVTWGRR